eukprot:7070130-Pyramimonas_sp.AAC.1
MLSLARAQPGARRPPRHPQARDAQGRKLAAPAPTPRGPEPVPVVDGGGWLISGCFLVGRGCLKGAPVARCDCERPRSWPASALPQVPRGSGRPWARASRGAA